ncbi:hypothetical protein DL1_08560 [Thioclava dalianensis]|uniref:Uncharacterized protein n=1 Tax=Thioclava dalianensis TaxID=1185766 RepID=A0A074TAM3_9RHOB|nr:hypothetical protein [Thioclava dalianensis]KEP68821.1 hypothetical protein DL1_08560 [Thioclava dalianensis]SFN49775.1 hypothetical protein SAMN05216224_10675 [Thioclava dalianensis]
MDRRTFLATASAAVLAPVLPGKSEMTIGIDFASGPDQTVIRFLAIQRGALREVHRVTGIPRHQLGADGIERDTWQDQVDAGLSEIVPDRSMS